MPVQPSPEAFAQHAFAYDAATLDKALADFIQVFYTWADDQANAAHWAGCFAEDATLKKAPTTASGRDEIYRMNLGSWKGKGSRHHTLHKVYPFCAGKGCDEVMILGTSSYVYEEGSTGPAEMEWAARLCFERAGNGEIAIKLYHIFPAAS